MEIAELEELRPVLSRYCYRMLGSTFDADDAVQDTLLRAWRSWDRLAEPGARRVWIHRIATNVCLDRLRERKRRALPMDLSEPAAIIAEPRDTLPAEAWVWPGAEGPLEGAAGDPAAVALRRETVRLAFVAALQTLPPRQRAVLILRDVFGWPAEDTARALDMTAPAVHSSLHRARGALARANLRSEALRETDAAADPGLLDRYVEAFERMDIEALVALFHADGSLSMPPFVMWVRGRDDLAEFYRATAHHCRGSRLLPLSVNGAPAFAQYAPAGPGEQRLPWGIHVLEVLGGRLAHVHTFIDAALYRRFGLPDALD